MLKIISGILLVICLIAIVFIAMAIFKLLVVVAFIWFVLWINWRLVKPLFTQTTDAE